MTVTVMIEREGTGPRPLTPAEEHELEIAVSQALVAVVRGGGDYSARRIALAVRSSEVKRAGV